MAAEITGIRETVRALERLGVETADLKAVFSDIAKEGARVASGFAPKRTGALAGSIRGNRAKSKAVVTAGKARVPYAGAINYGWPRRGILPAHFMQRADAALTERAVEMLDNGLDEIIRGLGLDE